LNPDLGGASRTSWLQDGITDIAVRAQERRAHRLMVQGDLSGAIRVYQEILRLDPDCARAHYQLGLCYRQRRQWSDAVEAFLQAVSLGETRAEPYLIEVRKRLPSRDGTIPSRYSDCAADGDGVADDGVGPAVVVGGHILTPDPPEVDRPTQEPTPSPSKPSPGVAEPKRVVGQAAPRKRRWPVSLSSARRWMTSLPRAGPWRARLASDTGHGQVKYKWPPSCAMRLRPAATPSSKRGPVSASRSPISYLSCGRVPRLS